MAVRSLLCATLLLSAILVGGPDAGAANPRVTDFNIVFVNYCDGLNLTIRQVLGVTGKHSGCGFNESVRGNVFTTADGEQGVTVQYFDQTVRQTLRIDVYRTGFRAGKFYVYLARTGQLQRFGSWRTAPPAP